MNCLLSLPVFQEGRITRQITVAGITMTASYDPLDKDNLPQEYNWFKVEGKDRDRLSKFIINGQKEKACAIVAACHRTSVDPSSRDWFGDRLIGKVLAREIVKAIIAELPR